MTSCETGEVTLGKATWLDRSQPQDGDLTVQVTNAQYNSTEYRDLFINMLATSANASASSTNCKLLDWAKPRQKPPEKRCVGCGPTPPEETGKDTFCNMAGFVDTQFFDGMKGEVLMFETQFGFKLGEIGATPVRILLPELVMSSSQYLREFSRSLRGWLRRVFRSPGRLVR
jgi:hypothetical protein